MYFSVANSSQSSTCSEKPLIASDMLDTRFSSLNVFVRYCSSKIFGKHYLKHACHLPLRQESSKNVATMSESVKV